MDDTSIVDLFWERNEAALQAAEAQYGKYCKSIALSVLHSESDAEECVNDTWLRAWETIPPKRPVVLSAYLAKIVRNLAIDTLRKNNAQKRSVRYNVALSEIEGCLSDKEEGVEQNFESAELAELINTFLRSVAKNKRLLFIGRYWQLQSVSELSKSLGISEASVKTTLHRTRNELKEFLEKEGYSI